VHGKAREADERREDGDEQIRVRRIPEDLEHGVDGDERRRVLAVGLREFAPHHDHCDAACESDHDKTREQVGAIVQKRGRKTEHQQRCDHPILDD
jgi:hypothetical protein